MSFRYFSNPALTLPAIGANFAASGPYASYVLLSTLPADGARMEVSAQNHSNAVALLILDDGSTAVGSVPPAGKATTIALTAAAAAGGAGGTFTDRFQGRIQLYGALSTSQVALSVR
jgi:ethanolamine utilization microcompartment shell protein EutS